MNMDPIFSLAGGLEKVYPRFSKNSGSPLSETTE